MSKATELNQIVACRIKKNDKPLYLNLDGETIYKADGGASNNTWGDKSEATRMTFYDSVAHALSLNTENEKAFGKETEFLAWREPAEAKA